jgi:hypothetical protein
MSHCKFCLKNIENCQCPIDITEPRLEAELAIADNIMAVENTSLRQSCDIIHTTASPTDSFSLLIEMERIEEYGTPIKNNVSNDNSLPTLKRQFTNINLDKATEDEDEADIKNIAVKLFTEEEIRLPVLERQHAIQFIEDDNKEPLITDADFSQFINDDNHDEFIFETIDVCEDCKEFVCICANLVKCNMPNCNNYYDFNYSDSSYNMCHSCEMEERRQELIHLNNCPHDNVGYF